MFWLRIYGPIYLLSWGGGLLMTKTSPPPPPHPLQCLNLFFFLLPGFEERSGTWTLTRMASFNTRNPCPLWRKEETFFAHILGNQSILLIIRYLFNKEKKLLSGLNFFSPHLVLKCGKFLNCDKVQTYWIF